MADPWQTLPSLRYAGRDGARFVFVPAEAGAGAARVVLTVVEDDVLRVQLQPAGAARVGRTWAVVGRAGDVGPQGRDREDLAVFACPEPQVEERPDGLRLRTARAVVDVALAPFALRWSLPDGTPLFEDHPELGYRYARGGGRGVRHTLRRDLDEVVLGLGEVSGALDRHARRYRLRPGDALGYDAERGDPLYKHLPVALTIGRGGHATGLLYDTGAQATFDFGSEIDHYLGPYRYAEFQATELDAYVLVGPALADVVRRAQDLTGYAPLPPRWSLGYLGSTMRYTDADDPTAELAGFVGSLRGHGIGCSGFHLSSGYSMGDDGLRYVFEWNRRRVPEPAAMVRALSDAGIRTLANVKPALLTSHPDHAPLAASGGLVRAASDDPAPLAHGAYRARFWGGEAGYVDFSHPAGYAWWRSRVRERILDVGIDATWNDNNEYRVEDDGASCAAGELGDLRPTQTLLMNHASRAAQRDAHPDRRDYQITRSGGLGMQRYAQTWSGDNRTSWHTLAHNLPMGLSMSLVGWANHGHDVGGFAGPTPDAELLVRWIEAGLTQPRFCIHSWNDDGSATEPWTHPEALPADPAADGAADRAGPVPGDADVGRGARGDPAHAAAASTPSRTGAAGGASPSSTCWATRCSSPRCWSRARPRGARCCRRGAGSSSGPDGCTRATLGPTWTRRWGDRSGCSARGTRCRSPPCRSRPPRWSRPGSPAASKRRRRSAGSASPTRAAPSAGA